MRHQDFLSVMQARDLQTLQRQLVDFAADLDFGLVNSWLVTEKLQAPAAIDYVGNRSAAFAEATSEPSVHRRDPVLLRLHRESIPFTYDRRTYVDSGNADMADVLGAHGYATGITVAMHLPLHQHFVLSFSRAQRLPSSEARLLPLLATLQLLTAHAVEASLRLFAARLQRPPTEPVSPKEREVLQRVLEGKSNWVIAQLIGVSENTVKFHLRNIYRKLGVNSRVAAACRAHELGLL